MNGVATTFKQVETKVNGTVTKVTKTYDDMSKTLLGTFTNVSETTFNGITTKVQRAVEKYADGSEHIKKTVTETGQRIGENGAETYEKIITYIDGIQDKVTETSNEIDKSVKGTQSRIDQQLSEASGQLDKGIFGLVKSAFSDAKNGDWAGLGLDFVNLIWGEVSQEQRGVISDWLNKALTAVNEGYFSGGIGKAFDIFQKLFSDGGVKSDIDGDQFGQGFWRDHRRSCKVRRRGRRSGQHCAELFRHGWWHHVCAWHYCVFRCSKSYSCPDPGRGRCRWRHWPCHVDGQEE